jgi:hypothetical protein
VLDSLVSVSRSEANAPFDANFKTSVLLCKLTPSRYNCLGEEHPRPTRRFYLLKMFHQ